MDGTSVISLASAKVWLSVDDTYNDADITRLINTAVAWIEQYTCYRLYPRDEVVQVYTSYNNCGGSTTYIPYFPINTKSINNFDGTPYTTAYPYVFTNTALSLVVQCPPYSSVLLNTGYTDPADIPQPLIDGALKLITYLYENRDSYGSVLPIDIQLLVNQYRRSPLI
jgi:hypothetical protein